jgi:predicted  nucleic acid-binding Zn-ribbon protein
VNTYDGEINKLVAALEKAIKEKNDIINNYTARQDKEVKGYKDQIATLEVTINSLQAASKFSGTQEKEATPRRTTSSYLPAKGFASPAPDKTTFEAKIRDLEEKNKSIVAENTQYAANYEKLRDQYDTDTQMLQTELTGLKMKFADLDAELNSMKKGAQKNTYQNTYQSC